MKVIPLIVTALLILSSPALASRSPDMPSCHFIGKVTQIETRKEPGKGMSEGEIFTYTDVSVLIVEDTNPADEQDYSHCDSTAGEVSVFQLPENIEINPEIDDCIEASSKWFGDGNFMSGIWLKVEDLLPTDTCE